MNGVRYSPDVMLAAAKYSDEFGTPAAAEKFQVSESTIVAWRKRFGFPPRQRRARAR